MTTGGDGGREITEVCAGLRFPEGPVAMPDGSVILVEMFAERLTRVRPDGTTETVAELPGGPNGAALGPDGRMYVCNNGGRFTEFTVEGMTLPGPLTPSKYLGGRIQAVDLATGAVEELYTECNGNPLWAPNDLVFDQHGGFYFTDHGLEDVGQRLARLGGIYYATADGSSIVEVAFPASEPNGIGLSPDGHVLIWAETHTGRLQQRRIVAPGQLEPLMPGDPWACLHGFAGLQLLDSLAIDSDGNTCVATLINGGISVVAADGSLVDFVDTGDRITTNICFGGPNLSTAYITLSSTGRLVSMPWPVSGLALHDADR